MLFLLSYRSKSGFGTNVPISFPSLFRAGGCENNANKMNSLHCSCSAVSSTSIEKSTSILLTRYEV